MLSKLRPSCRLLVAQRHTRCQYSQTACKASKGDRGVDPPDIRQLAKMAQISVTEEEVCAGCTACLLFYQPPYKFHALKAAICCLMGAGQGMGASIATDCQLVRYHFKYSS